MLDGLQLLIERNMVTNSFKYEQFQYSISTEMTNQFLEFSFKKKNTKKPVY